MSINKNIFFNQKFKNLKFSLLIYSTLIQKEPNININNNPILKLKFNLDEINEIKQLIQEIQVQQKIEVFLKFLFIYKNNIHDILYENEEEMFIDFEIFEKKIYSYIYLCFLIEHNSEINDYNYNFQLIEKLNNEQTTEKEKTLRKLIIAKIIDVLINNYNQFDENEDNPDNYSKIQNYNEQIIKDNIAAVKDFNLTENNIKDMKLEDIYINILIILIKEGKLSQEDYIKNIFDELELEYVIISQKMLDEIIYVLKEEKYIIKYKINRYEDIFNEKIITFYYYLIRYILKFSFYIYQIPFLFETRNNILKIINENIDKLYYSMKEKENENIKNKIEYVLNSFIEYNYYYNKSEKLKNDKSSEKKESSFFNKPSLEDAHINIGNDINISNNSISNPFSGKSYKNAALSNHKSIDNFKEEEDIYSYIKENNENDLSFKVLDNSIFTFHNNKKGEKPYIIYDEIKVGKKKDIQNIKQIEEYIPKNNKDNNILYNNYELFLKFLKEFEKKIENEFNYNYKIKITLEFKSLKNLYLKNPIFNINCLYKLEIPGEDTFEFTDEDILNNKTTIGKSSLINEINDESYGDKEYIYNLLKY